MKNSSSYVYTLFPTALGFMALAWGEQGIVATQLPEKNKESTVAALKAKFPHALEEISLPKAPVSAKSFIAAIQEHLAGAPQNFASYFSQLPLDLSSIPEFHQNVYKQLIKVRAGTVTSYRDLAKRAGSPQAARAVGQAMARNPFPLIVPCHRVLTAQKKAGGFSAYGGISTKAKLLAIEGFKGPHEFNQ